MADGLDACIGDDHDPDAEGPCGDEALSGDDADGGESGPDDGAPAPSGDAPLPAAPAPALDAAPPAPKRLRVAEIGATCVDCEGGRIWFYPSNGNFMAECHLEGHGRCSLTRTREAGAKKGQGRPLGLLAV